MSRKIVLNGEATNIAGSDIPDAGLSETSANSVQNKVVTKKFNEINDTLSDLPKVLDSEGNIDKGTDGKVLTSNGDGTYSWGEGGGGGTPTSVIMLTCTDTDFWGNPAYTVDIYNEIESYRTSFDSTGKLTQNVKYTGEYTIKMTTPSGTEDFDSIVVEVMGGIYTKEVGSILIGYHKDGNDSNPATRISYHVEYNGRKVKNYDFTPAHMDYVMDKFEYGDWEGLLDKWLMPRPCMLNNDGTVYKYLNPNDYTKYEDGTVSDIANSSFAGNAMVEWGKNGKIIWRKVIPDANGTGGTYLYSDKQLDEGFKCYSFIDCNNNVTEHFYTRIYEGSVVSNKTRSLSGVQPAHTRTYATEVSNAMANNLDSSNPIWYTGVTADWMLIKELLTMLGKSTNSQSVFGLGNSNSYVNNASANYNKIPTGTMNTKGMFWGSNVSDTSHLNGVKVFGMENWWGNLWERLSGDINDKGTRKIKLTYGTADGSTVRGYNDTGNGHITIPNCTPSGTNGGCISKNVVTELGEFAKEVSGSDSTYDCDGGWFNISQVNVSIVGGNCSSSLRCGTSGVNLDCASGASSWNIGGSLSCKPLCRRVNLSVA